MDWQKMGGQGPWGGYDMMPGHMHEMGVGMGPMGGMGMKMMMAGMRCPVCGEPLVKPTKQEMIEMLEHKKTRLQAAVDHLTKEIEKLKAAPQ